MQFEDQVTAGWTVANRDDPATTTSYFTELLEQYPGDARALFEAARAWDWGGEPDSALPLYEQAFAAGLDGDRLRRGLLQCGSTLRNLDRAGDAVTMLQRADQLFPGSDAVRSFLALALLSAGRPDEAVAELLDVALDGIASEDLIRYQWALRHYAAALRRGYWSAADGDGREVSRSTRPEVVDVEGT
jgi:tetratricopeptide (TPR) repeat protein